MYAQTLDLGFIDPTSKQIDCKVVHVHKWDPHYLYHHLPNPSWPTNPGLGRQNEIFTPFKCQTWVSSII